MKSKIWSIHWRVPVLMVLSCLAGLAFALGHHFFYNSLNGKPTPHSYHLKGLSFNVSGQQINVAIGSAFAFLVNHLLSMSIMTAYDQTIWHAVKNSASNISDVDAMFSFSFLTTLNFRLWGRFPLPIVLGVLSWLISIAAVFTPATLTVALAEARHTALLRVPRVDFTSLNFANLPMQSGLSPSYSYTGPQYSVQRVIEAAAAQGQILPIASPYTNSSWSLNFPGPALRCEAVKESFHEDILDNIATVMQSSFDCSTSYGYVAWTPDSNKNLPFVKGTNGMYSLRVESIGPTSGANALSIYLAVFPAMINETPGAAYVSCDTVEAAKAYLADATIIQCSSYNASYAVNFKYTNGAQDVDISIIDSYNDNLYLREVGALLATTNSDGVYILGDNGQPVAYNSTIVELYAYQSVMDSFGKILVGYIANSDINSISEIVTNQTTVMSTILSQSKELLYLENYANDVANSLQHPEQLDAWNGFSVNISTSGSLPMARSLEILFQNATISLMSNVLLQPNYSSPYAPPKVEVTATPYQNIYVYSADILWIAYGVAGSVAVFGVLVGVITVLRAGASFTSDFSTILRTTRMAELSTELKAEDVGGRDPLPGYIANATIRFPRRESDRLDGGVKELGNTDTTSSVTSTLLPL